MEAYKMKIVPKQCDIGRIPDGDARVHNSVGP